MANKSLEKGKGTQKGEQWLILGGIYETLQKLNEINYEERMRNTLVLSRFRQILQYKRLIDIINKLKKIGLGTADFWKCAKHSFITYSCMLLFSINIMEEQGVHIT